LVGRFNKTSTNPKRLITSKLLLVMLVIVMLN
jgi:hypothetical protein